MATEEKQYEENEEVVDQGQEEDDPNVFDYRYDEVTEDHDRVFRELSGGKEPTSLRDEDAEDEPEEDDAPEQEEVESDDEPDDQHEEEQAESEEPSEEDNRKAQQAIQQQGNKNYIDHELINSIEDKDLRQRVWNLMNTTQSHYNRVYAKEQEVNQLRNQLNQFQAEHQQAQEKASSSKEKETADKELEQQIAQLKEDYPSLGKNIDALVKSEISKETSKLRELFDKEMSPIKSKLEEESRQNEMQRLEEAANDIFQTETTGVTYRDAVASPEFQSWLQNQPESIQQLAKSDRAAEVTSLLKNFEYDYSRQFQQAHGKSWVEFMAEQNSTAKKDSSTNSPNDSSATQRGDQIKQERQKRKKAAVTGVKPSRHSSNSSANLDNDSLFDHFAKNSRYGKG